MESNSVVIQFIAAVKASAAVAAATAAAARIYTCVYVCVTMVSSIENVRLHSHSFRHLILF